MLKNGGISLHIFPSKLKFIESHVFVPFASVVQNRSWLLLWAFLGIRNSFQRGKGFREVADLNSAFLRDRTRYLSKAEIVETVSPYFDNLTFAEKYMVKYSYGKARYIYPLVKLLPFSASLYSTFYSRVIFFQKHV